MLLNNKHSVVKRFLLLSFMGVGLLACDRDIVSQNEAELISTADVSIIDEKPSFSIEQRVARPTILGKQKENPYSVENMQRALDTLLAYANIVGDAEMSANTGGIRAKSMKYVNINTTDLYVRFLPTDTIGYEALVRDTTLELFDHPLDYEIVQAGDYYRDPMFDANNPYTWLYATVKPNYNPPAGVDYEILEELFIIENSPSYSEEIIVENNNETSTLAKSSNHQGIIDNNLRQALIATSFVLTGNEKELAKEARSVSNNSLAKQTISNCSRKCILWGAVCWTSCDTYYYPEGYIKVNTPSGEVGLKGIKVRISRWFSTATARTGENGYYYCSNRFDDILIGNSANYEVVFEGQYSNITGYTRILGFSFPIVGSTNTWTFSKTMFGALCFWTSSYGLGSHSPGGHSMTFHTNSDYWGRAVLNNAMYDYMRYAKLDGISFPPANLDIASKESNDFTSSAPLLKNHLDWSLVYASPFWGTLATIIGYVTFGTTFPDLILRYNKNMSNYNKIVSTCWHELTHASQLQRMKDAKGYWWASDYWSNLVLSEVKAGNSYGAKGDTQWQIIALTEGWANYREWDLARRYLGYNIYGERTSTHVPYYFDDFSSIAIFYGGMFDRLINIGCSRQNIERSLCTYSIGGFRDNLINKHPSLSGIITSTIQPYE